MSRFASLKVEGGLLAADILDQVADGQAPGQRPVDFALDAKAHLGDEVSLAWANARRYWEAFQERLERLGEEETATRETRELWVAPFLSLLGFSLTYQARAQEVEGRSYPVSHRADPGEESPPVHVVSCRHSLDTRPPTGRPRLAPHTLLQEYLNRTEHLWGIVTNGYRLRILRDSQLMSRQAYLEFDLRQIMEGEKFADFQLLWRLVHRTRFPRGMDDAPDCLLEKYYRQTVEQGGRVRDRLRDGVERALLELGNGFLSHPANDGLRERVKGKAITARSFYQDLLRLVYRILFLMVAEERNLVSDHPVYRECYSLSRLRGLVEDRQAYGPHPDLWRGICVTFNLFQDPETGKFLHLSPLNGELFKPLHFDSSELCNRDLLTALWHLSMYRENQSSPWRRVNYAALDVEELGSVYESLLDFNPLLECRGEGWEFRLSPGTERRSTGSYYTPPELVSELVKSALEPVMAERLRGLQTAKEKEKALLSIRVCDPACGSGHFLLAAARRLGRELARVRCGESEPTPTQLREAVRDCIAHCIYGVDKNPLAVDLCKVALWIEGHSEGRPLSFLDHRIRCGDSLVGVFDLRVLEEGIPDGAFNPVSGDDKALAKSIKKDNKAERTERAGWLSMEFEAASDFPELSDAYRKLSEIPDETPEQVRKKQEAYDKLRGEGGHWWRDSTACHLWTAAFFANLDKESYGDKSVPTTEVLRAYLQTGNIDGRYIGHAWEMAQRFRFFHWPLEFPEVFAAGGFDVVLCNPPWERIKLQEQEFFATRDPEIANAPNKAARARLIKQLPETNPALWGEYQRALHYAEAQSKFLRHSKRFPLTARGDIDTYSVFSELFSKLVNSSGRVGAVVPTGIATNDTNKRFFSHLVESRKLASLYDFENRKKIFPAVDSRIKFSLLTLKGDGDGTDEPARFAFFLTRASQLKDEKRTFELTASDFALLNPNTRTCPIFRTRQDAELTKNIYERVPVLVNEVTGENPWVVKFMTMFHMANDSHLFRTRGKLEEAGFRLFGNRFVKGDGEDQEVWLPLYEAKMIHQFDHRFGSYLGVGSRSKTNLPTPTEKEHADPRYHVLPWYWVKRNEVEVRLGAYDRGWLLGFRDVARSTDERTAIFALLPRTAAGDNLPLVLLSDNTTSPYILCFLQNLNSLVLDYLARQKIGGASLAYFYLRQFPIIQPEYLSNIETLTIKSFSLELVYTSWDIKPFADDVWREADEELRRAIRAQWEENKEATGGHIWDPPEWAEIAEDGIPLPPFKWDEERRARLRAELDAIYAKLYGLNRKQLRYILDPADLTEKELENILDDYEEVEDPLDEEAYRARCEASTFHGETFRVLKEKEIKQYGHYRTRHLVLKAWKRLYEEVKNENARQPGEILPSRFQHSC
ncbi:MAG: Eco57I restriction-modification methylase domain-containing protein [Actinomycetota bacterium]